MMKDKIIKISLSAIGASVSAYLNIMFIPIIVLVGSMLIDYISGVAAAWMTGTLNSRIGKHGALKKVCYMLLVITAGITDWVVHYGFLQIGIIYEVKYYFGLIVTIWLILNELLSILENCTTIGLPVPSFIKPIVMRLKILTENTTKTEEDDNAKE